MHYQAGGGTAQDAADATEALWNGLDGTFHVSTTATIDAEVLEVESTTGHTTGIEPVTVAAVPGTAASDPLPQATQMLIRLRTGIFVVSEGERPKSHEIRGRIYVPSMVEVLSTDGLPTSATVSSVNSVLSTWLSDANSVPVVYSRVHREYPSVSSATMWTKFAVLRSRRD